MARRRPSPSGDATGPTHDLARHRAYAVYLLVAFVVRTIIQVRRTGDSGFRGLSGQFGTTEWWAGVLFVVALVVGVAAPIAGLLGMPSIDWIDHWAVNVVGLLLATAGISLTLAAQLRMGSEWRIGVDDTEQTNLVTDGLFALVRNPIFTAMGLTGLGLTLMVPNVVALAGFVALLLALELQVRVVEEPYLRACTATRTPATKPTPVGSCPHSAR